MKLRHKPIIHPEVRGSNVGCVIKLADVFVTELTMSIYKNQKNK